MERRRRALGLKKPGVSETGNEEKKFVFSEINNSSSSLKAGAKGSKHNIIPEQCTPKRKSKVGVSESPHSPLVSPSFHSAFSRALASPEVEVSWDWGCSQVPNDMLPPKRPKRKCRAQVSPLVEPVAASYSRLTQSQKTSTEENEERLAFYKNILSKTFQDKTEKISVVENNNLQLNSRSVQPESTSTPQRHRRSIKGQNKHLETVHDPFDDSANEMMLECSQAVEEKLKNGEIEGSLVRIDLEHPTLSQPCGKNEKLHGKTKQNLFPSEINSSQRIATTNVKSPPSKRLKTSFANSSVQKTIPPNSNESPNEEIDDPFLMPTQLNTSIRENHSEENRQRTPNGSYIKTSSGSFHSENVEQVLDRLCGGEVTNSKPPEKRPTQPLQKQPNSLVPNQVKASKPNSDSVDKFRRHQQVNVLKTNVNVTNQNKAMPVKRDIVVPQIKQISPKKCPGRITSGRQQNISNGMPGTKPKIGDITTLLDDDFDIELSTLDFDSLCGGVKTKDQPINIINRVTSSTQKCSKQEIEAKRLAALQRLKMKKNR